MLTAPHSLPPNVQLAPGEQPALHVAQYPERNGWRREQIGVSALGVPLVAFFPVTPTPTRVVWAAIHGEEIVTGQLANHLLRVVHASDACAVVVPIANPDGVLAGTRQNARGVDLNRNFPSSTWQPRVTPTFWSTAVRRTPAERTQFSSPGAAPGSEPEVVALTTLVERVSPEIIVDLHTPLDCMFALDARAAAFAEHLAEVVDLPVMRAPDEVPPGDGAGWGTSVAGAACVTYECELAPLPALWARHRDALVRCIVDQRVGYEPHMTTSSAASTTCPHCSAHLVSRTHEHIDILGCAAGHGLFVTSDALAATVRDLTDDRPDAEEAAAEAAQRSMSLREMQQAEGNARACPQCAAPMDKLVYATQSGVVTDVCRDHGVWLDAGELQQIEAWYEAQGQHLDADRSAWGGPDGKLEQIEESFERNWAADLGTVHWGPVGWALTRASWWWMRRDDRAANVTAQRGG